MPDVLELLREELDALSPAAAEPTDWRDVLRRAGVAGGWTAGGRRVVRHRAAAFALVLALAAALPALALSSSVRQALGLERRPQPVYAKARLLVEAPAGDGMLARLYEAPTDGGGECLFVEYEAAGSRPAPEEMTGGGWCRIGVAPEPTPQAPIEWSVGIGRRPERNGASVTWKPKVSGRVHPQLGAVSVVLEWSSGSVPFAFANDSFLLVDETLYEPPAESFPYWIVAYAAGGEEVARERLPDGAFSLD